MEVSITEEHLTQHLENLRQTLAQFMRPDMRKITFINLESLLHYTNGEPPQRNLTALLSYISPYIPLAITGTHVDQLLSAAAHNDDAAVRALEDAFLHDSKIKFINSVVLAKTAEEWNEIVNLCLTIHRYKKESRDHEPAGSSI